VFEAAVAETHARGLKVAADLLPWELPQLEQAVAAGIDSLEHGIVVQELIRKQADPPAEQSRVERLLADMQKRGVALTSTLVLFERAFTTMLVTDVPTYSALPEALQKAKRRCVAMVQRARGHLVQRGVPRRWDVWRARWNRSRGH
jgi:hypothetical protein